MVLMAEHHRVMRVARVLTRALLSALLLGVSFEGLAAADCTPASAVNVRSPANGRGSDGSAGSVSIRSNCSHESARTPESSPPDSVLHPDHTNRLGNTASSPGINSWSAASTQSAANVAAEHPGETEYETPVARSLSEVRWADPHDWIHNPPTWINEVKNYKKQGMPIIHLMQSKQTVIALGVSNHGKPGLYFTRKLPF